MPPPQEQATLGKRALKLTSQRLDPAPTLIDHVFHYGTPRDIPLVGDWNGDGTTRSPVFRDGWWYLDVDATANGRTKEINNTASARPETFRPPATSMATASTNWPSSARGPGTIDTNGNGMIDSQDQVIELGQAGDVPVSATGTATATREIGTYRDGEIAKSTRGNKPPRGQGRAATPALGAAEIEARRPGQFRT